MARDSETSEEDLETGKAKKKKKGGRRASKQSTGSRESRSSLGSDDSRKSSGGSASSASYSSASGSSSSSSESDAGKKKKKKKKERRSSKASTESQARRARRTSKASRDSQGMRRPSKGSGASQKEGRRGSKGSAHSRGSQGSRTSKVSSIASSVRESVIAGLWRLRGVCRRRCKECVAVAKEAVVREFQAGVGKTHTAKQVGKLRKKSAKQMKEDLRKWITDKIHKVSGSSSGPGRKKRRGKKNQWKSDNQNPGGFGSWTFIIHNPGGLHDFYTVGKEIGCGGSSKVMRAKEKMTGIPRAVKKIFKRDASEAQRIGQEVSMMKCVDHPNIARLYETFEDERALYMVLELCEGGDILDRLTEIERFSEYQAAVICRVYLMVMNYLNAQHIVHRDIKAENMCFKDERPDVALSNLRVVDFGFATRLQGVAEARTPEEKKAVQEMLTPVGSPYYMAPEVLSGGAYTSRCDLWSLGVLCYMLLSGKPPFLCETDAATVSAIKKGKFIFPKAEWFTVSKPAKHFIRRLLHVDPETRMNLRKAIQHPWIKNRGVVQIARMREETVDVLLKYHYNHRLRKAALLAVAYQLEASAIRPLIELFHYMDSNGDGILTREEFSNAVSACGIDAILINQMMLSVDSDNSGFIDFTELVGAMLEPSMYNKNHGAMMRAFRCFDQDDGGTLTMQEVAEVIDMNSTQLMTEVQNFFSVVDTNGDGLMDYKEFYHMLERGVREEDMAEQDTDQNANADAGKAAQITDAEALFGHADEQEASGSSYSSSESSESEEGEEEEEEEGEEEEEEDGDEDEEVED